MSGTGDELLTGMMREYLAKSATERAATGAAERAFSESEIRQVERNLEALMADTGETGASRSQKIGQQLDYLIAQEGNISPGHANRALKGLFEAEERQMNRIIADMDARLLELEGAGAGDGEIQVAQNEVDRLTAELADATAPLEVDRLEGELATATSNLEAKTAERDTLRTERANSENRLGRITEQKNSHDLGRGRRGRDGGGRSGGAGRNL